MKPIKTILHPTDFSAYSQNALEIACFLARDQKARLVILHVAPQTPIISTTGKAAEVYKAEHFEADSETYHEEMTRMLNRLSVPVPEITVERLLREGDAASGILQVAQEISSDLIVMGSHGKSGYLAKMLGSVAQEVAQKAGCPVLTVREPVNKK